jgi:hypothetical protein
MGSPPPVKKRKRHGLAVLLILLLVGTAILVKGFPANPVALAVAVAMFFTWLAILIAGTVLRRLGRL